MRFIFVMEDPNGLDATYSDTTLNYTVCSAIKCFTITHSFPLHIIISTATLQFQPQNNQRNQYIFCIYQ